MYGEKSKFNPCPICGKPRGKGPDEFSHGKCAEIRAATEGKKVGYTFPNGQALTKEQTEKASDNRAKKNYRKGKLPGWMYS